MLHPPSLCSAVRRWRRKQQYPIPYGTTPKTSPCSSPLSGLPICEQLCLLVSPKGQQRKTDPSIANRPRTLEPWEHHRNCPVMSRTIPFAHGRLHVLGAVTRSINWRWRARAGVAVFLVNLADGRRAVCIAEYSSQCAVLVTITIACTRSLCKVNIHTAGCHDHE